MRVRRKRRGAKGGDGWCLGGEREIVGDDDEAGFGNVDWACGRGLNGRWCWGLYLVCQYSS